MKPLHELGVAELGRALAAKEVSSVEITTHLLARMAAHAELGAVLCTDESTALQQARVADARRADGNFLNAEHFERSAHAASRCRRPER